MLPVTVRVKGLLRDGRYFSQVPCSVSAKGQVHPSFFVGGHMSPFRRSHAFARDVGKPSTKGSGAEGALRQALARRRLEERREAEMLKQNLYDVFSDDAQH